MSQLNNNIPCVPKKLTQKNVNNFYIACLRNFICNQTTPHDMTKLHTSHVVHHSRFSSDEVL